ncbi:L-ascorbate metabolism protein UlaG (beta-lactamase superfamily) [Novosphingobium gossypii]
MIVTMIDHAHLLIQAGGLNILTDPVWSDRTSPIAFAGPRRLTAPGIRTSELPPIDVIFLSHNHYDHLDLATLRHLQARHAPRIITPPASKRATGSIASTSPRVPMPISCRPCTGQRVVSATAAWP